MARTKQKRALHLQIIGRPLDLVTDQPESLVTEIVNTINECSNNIRKRTHIQEPERLTHLTLLHLAESLVLLKRQVEERMLELEHVFDTIEAQISSDPTEIQSLLENRSDLREVGVPYSLPGS